MSETTPCPGCGKPVPAGRLDGLCPNCLLAQGAETESGGDSERFAPPPVSEVAKLFPQLEVLSLLGAGGMGAVYKARQPALDRLVALKILPARTRSGVNFAERFNREARALARLSHPNIVAVHEFGQAGDLLYFLMEFVDGANLRQLERAGVLSPREALQIIPQICDALQYAHEQGVVHRDIKPENVLVDRKGRVKIADFGLAKITGAPTGTERLTMEGQVMGTPHYMAPEQVERPLAVDHRADIYALGVVFYEMLTGDLPLGNFPPPSRKVQVDVRFDEIVLRALENDPERRYQNASEVKSEVQTIATTPPITGGSVTPPADGRYFSWLGFAVVMERNGKRKIHWKGALVALAVLFGLLTIAFGFVSAVTGGSAWGFIGVVGWPSVIVRVAISAALVGWGVRRALHATWQPQAMPQTPRGTVILPSARRGWRVGRRIVFASVLALAWCVFQFQWLTPWLRGWLDKPAAAQIATRDASTGALIAKLPGRGTVELLAVGEPDGALNGWWTADGTPLSNTFYHVPGPVEYKSSRHVSRDILVRTRDLPNGASSAVFEAWPVSGSGSGGDVLRNGKKLSGAQQVRMAWDPSVRAASIYAGFGLDAWRTIATHSGRSQSYGQRRLPDDPNWTLNFHHAPTDTKDGAQIAVIFGPQDRLWMHQMVAVDTNGVEHPVYHANGTHLDKLMLWTFTFHRVPLAAVKEFHFQVRPVHWVEFPKVALAPRRPLPPPQELEYSAPEQQTFSELIDFDTGVTTNFPTVSAGHPAVVDHAAWMREQGFDAAAGARDELQVLDVDFLLLQNDDWERLAPADLLKRVHANHYRPPLIKPQNGSKTFGFRTREQGIGILQFVAYSGRPNERRTTLRYKMVELGSGLASGAPSQTRSRRVAAVKPTQTDAPPLELAARDFAGTESALSEQPELRFLAWQEEWKTSQPKGAWRPDGSPATNHADLDLLRKLPPSTMDVSATEAASRDPRFLHLWISHPLMNLNGLNQVTFLDAEGAPIKLGAEGSTAGRIVSPGDSKDGNGWYLCALSPGEGTNIPTKVTIRFRYAVGPLEREREIPSDFQGSMSLEGNSHLSGIGEDVEGRAFVAITADAVQTDSRHFGVVAATRDGRELTSSGNSRSGHVGASFRIQRFMFNAPLKEIARFRIGTRPILVAEWNDVPLPKSDE